MKLSVKHNYNPIICNSEFIRWIKNPTKEADSYWEQYLDNNPEKRQEIDEARFIIKNLIKSETSLSEEEVLQIWENVSADRSHQQSKKVLLWRLMAVASILIVLVISGWFLTQIIPLQPQKLNYQSMVIPKDAGGEVKLIFSDHSEKTFESKNVELKYNQKGEIETVDGKFQQMEVSSKKNTGTEDKLNTLIVPYGKRSSIVLADGTKLWSNSGSHAIFPVVFNKSFREISIEGEAYLEVVSNPEKPFFVVTDRMKLKVLGTRFNISAYKEEDVTTVVLVEGSLLAVSGENKNLMKPNQILSCDYLTGITKVHEGDVQQYISWKEGWLMCNRDKIGFIMTKLSRYYDVKIDANDKRINSLTITGKLELKNNCEEVLTVICKTAPIKFETIDHVIKLSAIE